MPRKVVARPKRAKSEKRPQAAKLVMSPDGVHEVLSTMRWLHEISERPSDEEIDVLRVEVITDWLREELLAHPGAELRLTVPTRREIREALAEHRGCAVIDFKAAAARVRNRREMAAAAP